MDDLRQPAQFEQPHEGHSASGNPDTTPIAVDSPPRYNIAQTATNKPHHLNAHMVEHPHGDYMESRYWDGMRGVAVELLRALEQSVKFAHSCVDPECKHCNARNAAIARAKEIGLE